MIIKTIIVKVLKNLVGMLVGPKMIFWALEQASKLSSNRIDDNVVALIEAAYNNDPEGVRVAAERLVKRFTAD